MTTNRPYQQAHDCEDALRIIHSISGKRLDPTAVAALEAQPHVLFRNMSTAAQAGFAALAPLSDPDGPRQITGYPCRRLSMAAGHGLCLAEDTTDPFGAPYRARFFGPDFKTTHDLPLAGLPSRARVSPDGSLGSATVFVNGDSYAGGAFSTRTTLFDMNAGTSLGDLETFKVFNDGQRIQSVDFNFWGVTFARDSNIFYASLRTVADVQSQAGQVTRRRQTFLVRGDLGLRKLTVLHENVECPSLSPNNRLIAYKKNVSTAGAPWRFYVLDLATMSERPIAAETRSIDDQIEWLDDAHVLYGTFRSSRSAVVDGG